MLLSVALLLCSGLSRPTLLSGRWADRSRVVLLEGPPEPDPVMKLVGTMLLGIEKTVEVAKVSTEKYINSGWQVRKRAGQLLPEIRPNVVDVQRRSELLAGGAAQSSELAPRSPVPTVVSLLQRDDNILAQTDADLTLDFQGYLAANRALVDGMREEANGEIVFRSNDALSTLVVGFTRQKLQALAISARSLARYVNDLETELEAADEAVVEMRRQQQESAKRQAKSERHARSLEVTASELELKLAEAAERLAASEAAAAQQEHRAEAAAEELMRMQSELEAKAAARALESNASETRSNDMDTELVAKERRRIVELEERLMASEAAARASEVARNRLLRQQEKVKAQVQAAEDRYRSEGLRVTELEQKVEEAEAAAARIAQALATKLDASEIAAREMGAMLNQVPAPRLSSPQGANETSDAQSDAVGFEEGAETTGDALSAYKELKDALFASGADPGSDDFVDADGNGGPVQRAITLRALTRMKKADLVQECLERGLLSENEKPGSVAELRARLRVERKRDSLVADLEERGFPENVARASLEKCGWNVDDALQKLIGR